MLWECFSKTSFSNTIKIFKSTLKDNLKISLNFLKIFKNILNYILEIRLLLNISKYILKTLLQQNFSKTFPKIANPNGEDVRKEKFNCGLCNWKLVSLGEKNAFIYFWGFTIITLLKNSLCEIKIVFM